MLPYEGDWRGGEGVEAWGSREAERGEKGVKKEVGEGGKNQIRSCTIYFSPHRNRVGKGAERGQEWRGGHNNIWRTAL